MGFKKLIPTYKSEITGSVSDVYYDKDTKEQKFITRKNISRALTANREIKADIGSKRTQFFSDKIADGSRVVGYIDPLVYAANPELHGLPNRGDNPLQAIGEVDMMLAMKWLDAHPEHKCMDIGLTFVKHKRCLPPTHDLFKKRKKKKIIT